MASLSGCGNGGTTVRPYLAKPHCCQPALARIVHRRRWSPRRTAQMQTVQRGSAACLQVRLIPHGRKLRQISVKGKAMMFAATVIKSPMRLFRAARRPRRLAVPLQRISKWIRKATPILSPLAS